MKVDDACGATHPSLLCSRRPSGASPGVGQRGAPAQAQVNRPPGRNGTDSSVRDPAVLPRSPKLLSQTSTRTAIPRSGANRETHQGLPGRTHTEQLAPFRRSHPPAQSVLHNERNLATIAPRLILHPTPNTRLTRMAPSGFHNVLLYLSTVGIRKSYGTYPPRAPCHVRSFCGRRSSLITATIAKTAVSSLKVVMTSGRRFVSGAVAGFPTSQG